MILLFYHSNYIYDANGNLIQDDQYYYEYNGFDQLVRVREETAVGNILEEYIYDGEGIRVQTIEHKNTS